jgi:hypothetical protein
MRGEVVGLICRSWIGPLPGGLVLDLQKEKIVRYEMTSIATADSLIRNDRVIREDDPFPYLVDRVEDQADTVVVTYSSGDKVTYSKRHPVIVVGRD